MSERSEPGPTTAPGVGTVSDELLRLRPDLDAHAGWRILLPRSYDVAMSEGGVEVLLAPQLEITSAYVPRTCPKTHQNVRGHIDTNQ